jgi:translation initiation factor 5B
MISEKITSKNSAVSNLRIRQPIVTVAGHVDSGKTSILDSIRGTKVYDTEAGGITQKISFTLFRKEDILKKCPVFKDKNIDLDIPGFLFIDTPGHAAFSSLRKRGGGLADLAILVIDINKGIELQTAEVLHIFKENKTPFIVVLNKVDNLAGWRNQNCGIKDSISKQSIMTQNEYREKLMTIQGALYSYGFEAMPFYDINDFSKNLALVPCSSRTGEGIKEIIMTLCGLSQKYLKDRLVINEDARGLILEVKKDSKGKYIEAVLCDGVLKSGEEIIVAGLINPEILKIKILEEILPLSNKFKTVKEATAATGIKFPLTENAEVLSGMPFQIYSNNKEKILSEMKKIVEESIQTCEEGIILKADSLGSLEATLFLLKEANINVCKAGIGDVDKRDVIYANTNSEKDVLNAIVIAFNVGVLKEAEDIKNKDVKIISGEVVYKIVEDLKEYRENKLKEIERKKMEDLTSICKLKVLNQYVFRNANPAIFGVRVEAGLLKPRTTFIDESGEEIGEIVKIQENKETLENAESGKEVAVSIRGANFERQILNKEFLYSDISAFQFKKFKENKHLLSKEEVDILQKISQIKRAKEITWGI